MQGSYFLIFITSQITCFLRVNGFIPYQRFFIYNSGNCFEEKKNMIEQI